MLAFAWKVIVRKFCKKLLVMKNRTLFTIAFLLITSFSILGQNAPIRSSISSESGNDFSILNVYPDEFPAVSVVFKAELDDNPIWDLSIDDIIVEEGLERCEKISLEQISEKEAIKIVLVFDHSESMKYDRSKLFDEQGLPLFTYDENYQIVLPDNYVAPIDLAKSAVKEFISSFDAQKDFLGLIGFSTEVDIKVPLTQDIPNLVSIIDTIEGTASTALFDAIDEGMNIMDVEDGIKIVVVLTDGIDNASKIMSEDVIENALEKEIPIYMIGLGEVNKDVLNTIAENTNGEFFHTNNSNSLDSIYNVVSSKIQAFYDLRYESPNLSSIEKTRTIKLIYDIDQIQTDSASFELPEDVIVYLAQKEKEKKQMIFGGILIFGLLAGGVLFARFRKKKTNYHIVKIYPNPSAGKFNLIHTAKKGMIIISDENGMIVQKTSVSSFNESIDLSGFNGIFYLQIETGDRYSNLAKIIITN